MRIGAKAIAFVLVGCAATFFANTGFAAEPSRVVRLTRDGLFKQRPAWSRDGRQLCFARHEGDAIRLFVMAADGSGERRLTDRKHPEYDAVWSPDGKRLAFTSNRDRNYEIYCVDATGANSVNLTNDPAFDHFAAWADDGRLAFVSDRDGGFEIYVLACRVGIAHH